MGRLDNRALLGAGVLRPQYDRQTIGTGIVHLGPGAFFRSHLAVYTDDALAASGGDWRIAGVSLRGVSAERELAPQDALFAVLELADGPSTARLIGSLSGIHSNTDDAANAIGLLVQGDVKIASLTVTEKGYCIDRVTGEIDFLNEEIRHDLSHPDGAMTAVGILTSALRQRRAAGRAPFAILCCDNLPENGQMVRKAVLSYTKRLDQELAGWIAENVAFPSTMVDRITPRRTPETLELAQELLGVADHAVVAAEPYRQWVIEDNFPEGRPDWDAGGAQFVNDVRPYEEMKLRMLNGAHSLIAYAGYLAGYKTVSDAMTDEHLVKIVGKLMSAAAKTLVPVDLIDPDAYREQLLSRFRNPGIAHETFQIAMDGSQKMPQRIFAPAQDAMGAGQDVSAFSFAAAVWIRFCFGKDDEGVHYEVHDPMSAQISQCLAGKNSASEVVKAMASVRGLLPHGLFENDVWKDAVTDDLQLMLDKGLRQALAQVATR